MKKIVLVYLFNILILLILLLSVTKHLNLSNMNIWDMLYELALFYVLIIFIASDIFKHLTKIIENKNDIDFKTKRMTKEQAKELLKRKKDAKKVSMWICEKNKCNFVKNYERRK